MRRPPKTCINGCLPQIGMVLCTFKRRLRLAVSTRALLATERRMGGRYTWPPMHAARIRVSFAFETHPRAAHRCIGTPGGPARVYRWVVYVARVSGQRVMLVRVSAASCHITSSSNGSTLSSSRHRHMELPLDPPPLLMWNMGGTHSLCPALPSAGCPLPHVPPVDLRRLGSCLIQIVARPKTSASGPLPHAV